MTILRIGTIYAVLSFLILAGLGLALKQCGNSPYPQGAGASDTLYAAFSAEMKTLDPAKAYFTHEVHLLFKILDTPMRYHYLRRPKELQANVLEEIPTPVFFGKNGEVLPGDPPRDDVARVEYTVRLKKGVYYAPHPCFAKDEAGRPLYRDLTDKDLKGIESPVDFPVLGTRELRAEDFALGLRRISDPALVSPIRATFERFLLGMDKLHGAYGEMRDALREERRREGDLLEGRVVLIDYMAPEFPGVQVVDSHTLKLVLSCKYPQVLYWMAMPFCAPVPMEALEFYNQKAAADKQFDMDHWPVGTNAHYLREYIPNRRVVLEANPNFRVEYYPSDGEDSDREAGHLDDAGKRLPLVSRMVMVLEKEWISSWNKFRQGYFDAAGIGSEVFDSVIDLQPDGGPALSPEMSADGIRLATGKPGMLTSSMYFNMLDDVVGGYSEEQAKLRRAISIAVDYNEYITLFVNGRGVSAQGIVPPQTFGYEGGEEGTNPYVDAWDPVRERHVRQPIETARRLMAEAGYPEGRDDQGRPLVLTYNHASVGAPTFESRYKWYRGRYALLGIELREKGVDLNRHREKMRSGEWQVTTGGWGADYPDPENFLFLLYGPNGKVLSGNENATNYLNPEFDALFAEMETMSNGPERLRLIRELTAVCRRDAPWVWGWHPIGYGLQHAWTFNNKEGSSIPSEVKFIRIDADLRAEKQREWNRPRVWPVQALAGLLLAAAFPAVLSVQRRERSRSR